MARQQRTSLQKEHLDFLIVLTASFFLFILVLFRFLSAHRPLLFFSFACLIPVNLSFPPFWFFYGCTVAARRWFDAHIHLPLLALSSFFLKMVACTSLYISKYMDFFRRGLPY
ncbi:hypothetical protein BCR44DRAFT_1446825 [Catenaria anguillulae PL171]|uniref:Uncharacterized protein n=1 Tax=Catenaria anguillulae PL171 TaxID=765915 RepID=A0A1Y2H7U2_9FUNG|nr:hypothetical protein BCR44DRAFT_1446825 [Catenaria anguillulae PL171]